jgi:dihydropteroate synthase
MTQTHYLQPLVQAADLSLAARRLAGGWLDFAACELAWREGGALRREVLALSDLPEEARPALAQFEAPRAAFAGVAMNRPCVMGIVNVTPDSFSDGGDRFDAERAIADGLAMWRAGADFVDVGGESTRPGAAPVAPEEELRRVRPVVAALAGEGVRVSIDSRHAEVMAGAVEAGAAVINDVTALTGDADSLRVAADSGLPVVLMHMQGEPRSMQADPHYDDVALEVYDHLAERLAACEAAGIPRARIAVDPGIGFGKTLVHNLELLDRLTLFHGLGCPLLLGVSRKSFIGKLSRQEPPKDRLAGSLAAALAGVARGAQILRVHDVAETLQALAVWRAIACDGRHAEDNILL